MANCPNNYQDELSKDICELIRKHNLEEVNVIQSDTQREIIFLPPNSPVTFANKVRKVHKWCIYQKLRCDNVALLINESKLENKIPWSKVKKGIEKIVDILLEMIEVDVDYYENWYMTFENFQNLSENVEFDLNKIGKMD